MSALKFIGKSVITVIGVAWFYGLLVAMIDDDFSFGTDIIHNVNVGCFMFTMLTGALLVFGMLIFMLVAFCIAVWTDWWR